MEPNEFQSRALAKLAQARSIWSPLFRILARNRRLRARALREICRLEGGQMWSITWRELMSQYYQVAVGLHSYGLPHCPADVPPGTSIGNYCSLAAGMLILRRNHPVDRLSQHPFFFNGSIGLLDRDNIPANAENPVTIGHDVWIGQNVLIAPGCRRIGNSSVIAAGSIVTNDVPDFAIVGGVPAKLIRWRLSEDLRAAWEQSQWWLKPIDQIAPYYHLFTKTISSDGFPPSPVALVNEKEFSR